MRALYVSSFLALNYENLACTMTTCRHVFFLFTYFYETQRNFYHHSLHSATCADCAAVKSVSTGFSPNMERNGRIGGTYNRHVSYNYWVPNLGLNSEEINQSLNKYINKNTAVVRQQKRRERPRYLVTAAPLHANTGPWIRRKPCGCHGCSLFAQPTHTTGDCSQPGVLQAPPT